MDQGFVIGMVLAGLIALVVMLDAAEMNRRCRAMGVSCRLAQPLAWGIFVFLIAIVGLPVYLITRSRVKWDLDHPEAALAAEAAEDRVAAEQPPEHELYFEEDPEWERPKRTLKSGARTAAGILLVIIGVLVILLMVMVAQQGSTAPTAQPGASAEAESPLSSVTLASYEGLTDGDSLSDVEDAFGISGSLLMNSSTEGVDMDVYSWTTDSGATVTITFFDGKLVSKSQVGLE